MTVDPISKPNEFTTVVVAAFGSICVGTVPFLVRSLLTSGFDTVSLLFWRYAVALLVLVPAALWSLRGERTLRDPAAMLGIYGCGVWGAMQAYAYYAAVETVATSVVGTIFFAYPIFTLLLDRFVLRVDVPRSTAVAVITIFIGVILTGLPQLRSDRLAVHGLMLAAAAPVLYALYITFSYALTRRLATFVAAALIYLGQLTAYAMAAALTGLKWPASPTQGLLLLAIGTLGGAVQIACFSYALPRLSASGYAVVVSLELVTVVMIGAVALGESLTVVSVIGIALVLTGVVLDRLMRAWSKRTTPSRRA